jgi:hypothetical protein
MQVSLSNSRVFIRVLTRCRPGAAGLSLSYALTFTDYVLWIVRLWAACEQNLTSVERLGECELLEGITLSLR